MMLSQKEKTKLRIALKGMSVAAVIALFAIAKKDKDAVRRFLGIIFTGGLVSLGVSELDEFIQKYKGA